jgi:hypothetical protein
MRAPSTTLGTGPVDDVSLLASRGSEIFKSATGAGQLTLHACLCCPSVVERETGLFLLGRLRLVQLLSIVARVCTLVVFVSFFKLPEVIVNVLLYRLQATGF